MKVDVYRLKDRTLPLLRRFEAARGEDKIAESNRAKYGKRAGIGFAAMVVSLILAAQVVGGTHGASLLLPAALLAFTIHSGVHYARSRGQDLDNRKLETVLRLLRVLGADVPADGVNELAIDFRRYDEGTKPRSETPWRDRTRRLVFSQRWLGLETKLADGNQISLGVTDRVTRKEKRKRKKTKVRERVETEVVLEIRLDKRYGAAAPLVTALEGSEPPPAPFVKATAALSGPRRLVARFESSPGVRAGIGRAEFTSEFEGIPGADACLEILAWAYRGMAPTPESA